jgi:hypothetical protein
MTKPAEIKARVTPALRDRFNAACTAIGMTVNTRLTELICADLDRDTAAESARADAGPIDGIAEEIRQLQAHLDRQIEALPRRNSDAISGQLAPLKSTLKLNHFEQRFDRLTTTQIERFGDQHQALQRIENHLTELSEDATNRLAIIARELQIERPALHQDRRVQFGAVAGLLFAFAAVALLPGTSWPARAVARFAVGESGDVQAASIIAAKGDKWDSGVVRLVIEANHDDRFNRTFNDCLLRAKIAFKRTYCTLDVPMVR